MNKVVVAYGFEPGAARRLNPEGRFVKEIAPTLRSNMGDNQIAVVLIYDARGNGNGEISPTITGDHKNRITDYTAIVVEYEGKRSNSGDLHRERTEGHSVTHNSRVSSDTKHDA